MSSDASTAAGALPALVVVGSNHEYAPVSVRERLAFAGDALAHGLRALRTHVGEGLILSTCNRTEIYVVGGEEREARDGIFDFLSGYHHVPLPVLERASYVFSGKDAVDHMFRVASGLDSMVLGEPQILSQIRDALDAARDASSAGPMLQRLATDALRVGKRARTETDISRNRNSIAHAAVELAERKLGTVAGRSAVVLGAGNMATLTAKLLRARGIGRMTIVNRSFSRAVDLAEATDADARPMGDLAAAIADADLLFGAATAETPLVTADTVTPRSTSLLLIDLSVPRVIASECEMLEQVTVHDVDALEPAIEETRRLYAAEVSKVEDLVASAVTSFAAWTQSRASSNAIAALRTHAEEIRDREVERTLRKLGHLSDRDRNLVRAMGVAITNKLLHQPVQSLRAAETAHEIQLALDLFGLASD